MVSCHSNTSRIVEDLSHQRRGHIFGTVPQQIFTTKILQPYNPKDASPYAEKMQIYSFDLFNIYFDFIVKQKKSTSKLIT
jgi:hypothetical protein